jgi:mono/diheme cytochrome c family protein
MTASAWAQSVETQARVILAEKCLSCHGAARMSGLRLDSRAGILAGGTRGPAAIPGKASESLLYQAVVRDGKLQMPPGPNALPTEEVAILRAWIDAGLAYSETPTAPQPTWWSFVKPVRAASARSTNA